jgi:hypothetical protein
MGRQGYLVPVKSDGTAAVASSDGYYNLPAGTWYIVFPGPEQASQKAVHCEWNAALAGTIQLEDANALVAQVSNHSAVGGNWLPQKPDNAYAAISTSGVSFADGVVTVAGSAVGGCMWHFEGASARQRLAFVVSTAGLARFSGMSKG